MYYKELIDELLQELSYRVGIPDLKNKEHQSIISEILTEWGEFGAKETIFKFLNEAPKPNKNDDRYKSVGYGKYKLIGKEGEDDPTYEKDEKGNYIKLGQGEEGGEGEQQQGTALNKNTKSGKSYHDNVVSKEDKTRKEIQKQTDSEESKESDEKQTPQELESIDKDKVKNQILMTQKEAEQSQEGVGLGTAESRTGESVTVYAGQKIQELINSGKSYEDARDEIETELLNIANNKEYVLTKEWVKSGLAVFDYLNDTIGVDNIKHFAWDTPQGNALVGSTGHGTSADMFVKTDNGDVIGVSLKKDFKVFIVNGGYGKAMKQFEEKVGLTLPENCQAGNYTKRRNAEYDSGKETVKNNRKDFEETAEKFLNDEEFFNKIFGPKSQSYEKRKRFIEKKLGISNWKDATPQQLVDILINENQKSTGDDLKFFASFNKESGLREKFGIYTKLRGLDNEMTDNIFKFFQENDEAKSKYKEKIIEDTHIIDTLFPNPPLTDFKTVFGTDPAVEMTREAIGSIFGVSDLMDDFNKATSDDEKAAIRSQIEKQIKDKLVITKKKGVPVIAINLDGPPQSELPLYKLGVRTRGIGNAQTLEVSQETFGSLALKNGNTNVSEWDDKDRRTVVEQESKDMLSLFEDEDFDISDLSSEELQDINERVTLLKTWYPKSPSLKKLSNYI